MSIAPLPPGMSPVAPIAQVPTEPKVSGSTEVDFGSVLADARELETKANKVAEGFANGDATVGIHEVMIASEKANVSLRFATTLKNKALEAYRELMNTQV